MIASRKITAAMIIASRMAISAPNPPQPRALPLVLWDF
jgi:hypothetical protein